MTFEELDKLMPPGIACGAVRSWHPDRHWNVRFWREDQQGGIGNGVTLNSFSMVLRGFPGESIDDIIRRGLPVVQAVVIAFKPPLATTETEPLL